MARFTVCDIAASTPKSSNTERANPDIRFAILFMLPVLSRQEIEWNGLGLSQWIFSVKRLVRLSALRIFELRLIMSFWVSLDAHPEFGLSWGGFWLTPQAQFPETLPHRPSVQEGRHV